MHQVRLWVVEPRALGVILWIPSPRMSAMASMPQIPWSHGKDGTLSPSFVMPAILPHASNLPEFSFELFLGAECTNEGQYR